MQAPLFEIGQTVYLKESAALGFLEAVVISGVQWGGGDTWSSPGWLYTIRAGAAQPTPVSHYGDRRSLTSGAIMYFSEDEFILVCDALELVEANLQAQLTRIQAQRTALCDVTA